MSNPRKHKPHEVFAVVPDEHFKDMYIAMWENYLGEIKSMPCKASDELDAYKQATAYIKNRRSRKK